jgi:Hypoxia induced protein conserved region
MFRARVYAQGFTVLAMVAGSVYWQTDRQKRKEFDKAVSDRNAQEKRDAWVRELEARDEEEKELRAMREARRRGNTPSQAMEVAITKAKGNSKKKVKEEWKEDPAEMQLGVASSAAEKEKKGILGSIQGVIWGSKK